MSTTTTSVETLRKAAAEIREDWDGDGYGERSDFMLAVADLLQRDADTTTWPNINANAVAVAVARAYLEGAS